MNTLMRRRGMMGNGNDMQGIVSVSVATEDDFGYSDVPTYYPKLKYARSILLISTNGDTSPKNYKNQFPFSYIRHNLTKMAGIQWYAESSSKSPSECAFNTASQSLGDLSIRADGTIVADGNRKFCGAGCVVRITEIPINEFGEVDMTLWENA